MVNTQATLGISSAKYNHIAIPVIIIIILVMIMLPLPTFMLDMLFTFNIALSLMILLATIYTKKPLEFSLFPTILLLTTLLRLALNIASTRVVLLHGQTGTAAAGQVIQSFGEVVIAGNYTVGIIVFLILMIINFIVVTKGASRISEVSARFTLDAMPGKQMAIDADLNAGIISQGTALSRRREVAAEADFYGTMDGASKFVRGDAIAGLLILLINIIGGLIIGISQYQMSINTAARTYTLLTIGDGLAAQIPSLLLSTAAAIIVTRMNSEREMGSQIIEQLIAQPKVLIVTAVVIGSIGLIPGMPHLAFLLLALSIVGTAYLLKLKQARTLANQQHIEPPIRSSQLKHELDWQDIETVSAIKLEVGYRLIDLISPEDDSKLIQKIKNIRRKLSTEIGFLIPKIDITDNFELNPNEYRLSLFGVTIGEETIYTDKALAINPGKDLIHIPGVLCKEPSFKLDALWINASQKDHAESLGYKVVDPHTVIATHISQSLQYSYAQLLGHEETQRILQSLAKKSPKLADELVPNALPFKTVVKVLQCLLAEQVPIIDVRTIAETLIEHASKNTDPEYLTGQVRIKLKHLIVQKICGSSRIFTAVTLTPELEHILQDSLQVSSDQTISLEPKLAEKVHLALGEFERQQTAERKPAIILVAPNIRNHLVKLFRSSLPRLHVLSYQELPDNKEVNIIGSIGV